MSELTIERPLITHLSHSQVSSFARCGEAYRLTRIAGVREFPAYWSIGGNAVHTAIEHFERQRFEGETPNQAELVELFRDDLQKRYVKEGSNWLDGQGLIDPSVWRAAGRGKEDLSWWKENGSAMIESYCQWRPLQPYEILEMPDGSPAIEVPFIVTFPETELYRAVEIHGFIDAVIAFNTGVIGLRDYKSGSRKPDSTSQLGLYAHALEQTIGIRPTFGDYLLTRKMVVTEPDLLNEWTSDVLHASYDGVLRGREAGAFVPNVGQFCGTCGVKQFCRAKGNPKDVARFVTAGLVRS